MNTTFDLKLTLHNVFVNMEDSLLRKFLLGLAGVLVLAFASQLSIPLTPVPLSFQSATVVLIGMAYGARYGSYVVMSYIAAGICGMPVFADFSAGPHVLIGPTGGYIIGFIPAAFVSGYLAKIGFAKQPSLSFVAACIGAAIIFSCGLLQLSTFMTWSDAVTMGLMPFIVFEPIKLIAVSFIIPKLWK